MTIDIEKAMKMREEGKTLEEIGEYFGVSKQRAHAIIGGYKKANPLYKKIKYKGLRKWFKENDVTFSKFARMVGANFSPSYVRQIQNWLSEGGEGRKFTVDQIKTMLELTGMTFEELFEED